MHHEVGRCIGHNDAGDSWERCRAYRRSVLQRRLTAWWLVEIRIWWVLPWKWCVSVSRNDFMSNAQLVTIPPSRRRDMYYAHLFAFCKSLAINRKHMFNEIQMKNKTIMIAYINEYHSMLHVQFWIKHDNNILLILFLINLLRTRKNTTKQIPAPFVYKSNRADELLHGVNMCTIVWFAFAIKLWQEIPRDTSDGDEKWNKSTWNGETRQQDPIKCQHL